MLLKTWKLNGNCDNIFYFTCITHQMVYEQTFGPSFTRIYSHYDEGKYVYSQPGEIRLHY